MVDLRQPTIVAAALVFALIFSSAAHANLELARAKNCTACHHLERKMNGPAYKTIAERYAGNEGAAKVLAEKVRTGGAGVWGPSPMPAQPQVSPAEAEALVQWILSNK